jgi:DNA repair exonuclease SbcCD ATPase subunit
MDQEKFVNKYIELLNNTISEAIQKNIVAQAQKTILEEEVSGFSKQLSEIKSGFENRLSEKEKENNVLKSEINTMRQQMGSIQTNLHEANVAKQHFETYKNELTSARTEIENLKKLIEEKDKELAKYKPAPEPVVINKLGKKNTPSESKILKVKNIKDAGSF